MSEFAEAVAALNSCVLASFGIPPAVLGPEPLRCPVDGWTRDRCLSFWGHDPVHEQAIRDALSILRPDPE